MFDQSPDQTRQESGCSPRIPDIGELCNENHPGKKVFGYGRYESDHWMIVVIKPAQREQHHDIGGTPLNETPNTRQSVPRPARHNGVHRKAQAFRTGNILPCSYQMYVKAAVRQMVAQMKRIIRFSREHWGESSGNYQYFHSQPLCLYRSFFTSLCADVRF